MKKIVNCIVVVILSTYVLLSGCGDLSASDKAQQDTQPQETEQVSAGQTSALPGCSVSIDVNPSVHDDDDGKNDDD